MKLITVGAIWLFTLTVGSLALPSQSLTHSRSGGNSKQTIPSLYFNENEPASLAGASNSTSSGGNFIATTTDSIGNEIMVNKNDSKDASKLPSGVSITNDATIATLSSSLSAVTVSTNRNLPVDIIEPSSTASSSSSSSSSQLSTRTSTTKPTTTTTNTSNSSTGSNATPTEASSRTIASIQDASNIFLSSSTKKSSTTSFNEFTTTPATISPKETRESPGKIRPQIKLTTNYTSLSETGVRLPEGASAALAKPTKYHYYPHNQHIYLLPECAVQQVCNAVYVRLNFTQPLCACPGRYRDPCSASLDSDDLHTTELVTDPRTKALTLVKTCEPVAEMRECRTPRDWSLLALQNVRTGKSHYLVICRCPDANILEGPMSHDQPTYASVPGIRVYGMMCVQGNRRGRPLRYTRSLSDHSQREIGENSGMYNGKEKTNERLSFPWYKVQQLMNTVVWD
ncbi:hypothetical protein ANTQUA_LOCUS6021 [Anthophora quadrimaculata]